MVKEHQQPKPASTIRQYWWQCSEDNSHERRASPANRIKLGSAATIVTNLKGKSVLDRF